MNILFITTKPPWPVIDGGRLLVKNTLEGLAAAGHRVTLVSPAAGEGEPPAESVEALRRWCAPRLVAEGPRSMASSVLRSQLGGVSLSIARHKLAGVRREVERCLVDEPFDVVHVEQLQALAQAEPAHRRGLPVVLRAQNVESDLWAATAGTADRRLLRAMMRREACRVARGEKAAMASVAATVALTGLDAERLRELADGQGRLARIHAPFPASLPAADAPLSGSPAVVQLGSEGWLPNRDSVEWFAGSIWPAVRAALPEARLHVYGNRRQESVAGLVWHESPADSREIFAPGAILAVPLRIASGVRMKILEAWARGVPVVATSTAARGLDVEDGRELLVAEDEEGFAAALQRLHEDEGAASSLVAAGRAKLMACHDASAVTADLVAVYEEAIAAATSSPRGARIASS